MASEENKVNALWIGKQLSKLELLTLHSFIAHGHSFKLWLYDELENDLPESIEIGDASVIIPREKVFSYRNQNSFGHGKGSYAGFSDIFRYKLLHEHGKQPPFRNEYFCFIDCFSIFYCMVAGARQPKNQKPACCECFAA